jgi:DNA-binding XRE family transcriptional regulator
MLAKDKNYIYYIRKKLDLTIDKLAFILNIHRMTLYKIEKGMLQIKPIQFEILRELEKATAKNSCIGESVYRYMLLTGYLNGLYYLLKLNRGD